MNARKKLNVAYANDCLLMAAIAGGATGSWVVFLLAAAALAAASVANGQIRHRPTRR
ncbi:hypothetical protein [Paludisphaera mucosa]|uniref:Uncharacterized protein n=1 Tax=Paludisphaera mucosa TaxID=3030827 RepID=A0ABT6FCZ9_9BACT|nr:hypothetical protein [Paludisphaera mucosa]MDG3005463.1 hypothetical protein [Paludisphaera mucosa]